MIDSNTNKSGKEDFTDSRENMLNDQILTKKSELLNNLDNLEKIKFINNIFGIGSFTTIAELNDDQAVIQTKFDDKIIKSKIVQKNKFLHKLNKIHMNNWKRYYSSNTLDGHIWSLVLYFENGEIIKTGGNNNYPENFKKLRKLLKVGKLKYPKIES